MKRLFVGIALVLLLLIGLSACADGGEGANPLPTPEEDDVSEGVPLDEDEPTPLTFALSEGVEGADEFVPSTYVRGDSLSDEELASILDRLPDLVQGGSDAVEFNRPQSIAIDVEARELIVNDSSNHRIGRFTLDGELISWLGGYGREGGRFHYPYGLCLLGDGARG